MPALRPIAPLLAAVAVLAGCAGGPGTRAVLPAAGVSKGSTSPIVGVIVAAADVGTAAAAVQRAGLGGGRAIAGLNAVAVDVPVGQSATALAGSLGRMPGVTYTELNRRFQAIAPRKRAATRKLTAIADDPEIDQVWGLVKLGVSKAWAVTSGAGVTVAVLDTGVDLDHPDLRQQLVPGTTYFDEPGPRDLQGHGTHVSGIIAAAVNNGVGIAGVAPGCKIMPVKVIGPTGISATVEDVCAGLIWAVDHGATVVNMSLGDSGSSPTLRRAVQYAQAHDVLLVAATGNFDPEHPTPTNTLCYPAGMPGVVAVGAIEEDETLASFSFWGNWVSVVAPGVGIHSTLPEGSYGDEDGTSMATPYVAGVAALVRAKFPQLTAAQVKLRLERTAVDLGPAGFDPHFGHGRVDAARAILGQ